MVYRESPFLLTNYVWAEYQSLGSVTEKDNRAHAIEHFVFVFTRWVLEEAGHVTTASKTLPVGG